MGNCRHHDFRSSSILGRSGLGPGRVSERAMGVRPLNEPPEQPGDECPNFLDAMELLRTGMGVVVQSSKGEGLVGPSADSRR
jgi:hypothetical protein